MQEIDAIQNKRESKIISSINNDTSENGYIVFDYREKSGYRNFDTQDWMKLIKVMKLTVKIKMLDVKILPLMEKMEERKIQMKMISECQQYRG